jgi:hypothetical protein
MKSLLTVITVMFAAACNSNVAGADPTAQLRQAKESLAKSQIATMSTALEAFKVGNSEYPTTLSGALEQPGPDPWGSAWIYVYPAKKGNKPYDLYSAGPDKTPNTADDVR